MRQKNRKIDLNIRVWAALILSMIKSPVDHRDIVSKFSISMVVWLDLWFLIIYIEVRVHFYSNIHRLIELISSYVKQANIRLKIDLSTKNRFHCEELLTTMMNVEREKRIFRWFYLFDDRHRDEIFYSNKKNNEQWSTGKFSNELMWNTVDHVA